jgi:hypothetical protein
LSTIEHQRQNSVASLRRHEAARDRATKLKSVPVTVALEIAAEDEAEPSDTAAVSHPYIDLDTEPEHDEETEDTDE